MIYFNYPYMDELYALRVQIANAERELSATRAAAKHAYANVIKAEQAFDKAHLALANHLAK